MVPDAYISALTSLLTYVSGGGIRNRLVILTIFISMFPALSRRSILFPDVDRHLPRRTRKQTTGNTQKTVIDDLYNVGDSLRFKTERSHSAARYLIVNHTNEL